MPYIPSAFGANSGSASGIATPAPAVESDKTARINAIFQGVTGALTTAADVYERIKYRPRPQSQAALVRDAIQPNYAQPVQTPETNLASIFPSDTGNLKYVALAAAAIAVFLIVRK